MALQLDYYEANLEVDVPECYWKITKLDGNKQLLNVYVGVFKNKDKADANFPPINEFLYQFTPDLSSSDNFLTQGYNYLKTLDEFKDAVDV
jgi:hypothetical protein